MTAITTTYEPCVIGKKAYIIKVTCNKPSDEALESLSKKILEIFEWTTNYLKG